MLATCENAPSAISKECNSISWDFYNTRDINKSTLEVQKDTDSVSSCGRNFANPHRLLSTSNSCLASTDKVPY